MNNAVVNIIESLAIGLMAFVLGYLLRQYTARTKIQKMREEAESMLAQAKMRLKEAELEAKAAALKIRDKVEREIKRRRSELDRQERRLQQRRATLDRRMDAIEERARKLDIKERQLERQRKELEQLRQKEIEQLERISSLSLEEAKELLLQKVEHEARQDMARIIREIEAQAREEGERKAREIITLAIQRVAADQVAETTVSAVLLPNDEMKGRIIGRGGRNIRAIENATGVDLVVDDTPEAVILSSFDPVRREIARVALNKLVLDGRIHPARIEKVVKKARQEVEAVIQEEGERAVYEIGVHGLHPELVKLLGQLKYRTSYGQNVLMHSIETAHLAGIMAAELGANVALAKEGGLLHDIGKAIDREMEGTHLELGVQVLRKFGESGAVIHAMECHHGDVDPRTVEAVLVSIADSLSAARPGARRESLESYVRRLEKLEVIAGSFKGVEKAYAIQAGRELRIIVEAKKINDNEALWMSKDVARRIEKEVQYPGQIKVTVIRETRAIDYAK